MLIALSYTACCVDVSVVVVSYAHRRLARSTSVSYGSGAMSGFVAKARKPVTWCWVCRRPRRSGHDPMERPDRPHSYSAVVDGRPTDSARRGWNKETEAR